MRLPLIQFEDIFVIEFPLLRHEVSQFHHEQVSFSVQRQQTSGIARELECTVEYKSGNRVIENHQKEFDETIARCARPMQPYAE